MITKIKFCGITSVNDALAAVDCGADFIGLIFADESPRKVPVEVASKIVQAVGATATCVGVFKNQSHDKVADIVGALNLSLIQYHGKESVEQCKLASVPVIKVFESDEEFDWTLAEPYLPVMKYMMIDRPKGFSGIQTRWRMQTVGAYLKKPENMPPVFFAGGLNPDNVGAVVSLARPFAVDCASGVEAAPGVKDLEKMKKFCQAVKEACRYEINR